MQLPTPCHIIDLDHLNYNLENPIFQLRKEASCKVILALKGFSSDVILPYMVDKLDGFCASGLFEARLGREYTDKLISTFSPVYSMDHISQILDYSNMVVFNSLQHFLRYHSALKGHDCSCGIRINPEYSELPKEYGANPCTPESHLGIRKADMPSLELFAPGRIEGIHLHTMCAQYSNTLERTVDHLEKEFDCYLKQIRWLNLGGGQLLADPDYDIAHAVSIIKNLKQKYNVEILLEPCEGVVTGCGYYVTTVMDIIDNQIQTAILDGSAICHMSDCVYRNWRRDILGALDVTDGENNPQYPYQYRLAGSSCYAGDIFGIYAFKEPLRVGDRIIFSDTASYTMVKACMFNGIPFPALATYSKKTGLSIVAQYDYLCFHQIL